MEIQPIILKKLDQLPESLQMEVLHYVEFLLAKQTGSSTTLKAELMELAEQSSAQEKFSYGCLAGKIHMSEDFDEPLEDLAEYM